MSDALLVVIVLELAAVLALLVDLAWKLRGVGANLAEVIRLERLRKTTDRHHGFGIQHIAAFAIWAYEGGRWILLSACGQAGCECAPPPPGSGKYGGQVVRKECPPR
jgi:hypothetical protein